MTCCDHEAQIIDMLIYNRIHLREKWHGWRLAGETLVSPDGLRIRSPQLRALFWAHGAAIKKRIRKVSGQETEQLELF